MQTHYDYSRRYRGNHSANRQRAISRVQLDHATALCPFCWRRVPVDLYTRPAGQLNRRRQRNANWMEAHHLLGYLEFSEFPGSDLVPACRTCHMSKLHHPSVWVSDRRQPDQNHNVFWFRVYARVRLAAAVLVVAAVRSLSR